MPPVAPQSSRAGLITAVVIFVVLFVAATIFAIYYAVDANKTHDRLTTVGSTLIPREQPEGSVTSPQQMAEVRAQATQETQAAASDRQAKQINVASIETSAATAHQQLQEELNKAQTEVATKNSMIERLNTEMATLHERLGVRRISPN